jgi:hypothetical protein
MHKIIIKTHLMPEDFEPDGQFHLPEKGPVPPTLRKVGIKNLLNRKVFMTKTNLGTYGMGGPGFLGFGLEKTSLRPCEWLVLRLWGAADWLLYDSKPFDPYEWPPKASNHFEKSLEGCTFFKANINRKSFDFYFENSNRYCGNPRHILEMPIDQTNTGSGPIDIYIGVKRNWPAKASLLDAFIIAEVKDETKFPTLIV